MLSRVAERIYWLARYLERAEDTSRLILVRHNVILDLPRSVQPDWELLLRVLGAREHFADRPGAASEKNIMSFVFSDRDNPSSIMSSLTNARENMRTSREVLPSETWERVNSLYLSVARRANKGLPRASRHSVLNTIVQSTQQISGMLAGTMNHDASYQFLQMGRYLERADMTTRIIDVASEVLDDPDEDVRPYQNVMWVSALQSLSAYQMYRLSVGNNVRPPDALQFLLRSGEFPRALSHCLLQLEAAVKLLPRGKESLKAVQSVHRKVKRTNCAELEGEALEKFLDSIQVRLQGVHEVIEQTWFTPEQ
ncbi:MAG: alpha-E domain-containing protein [Halieaceae bacterium]|nr:alpha-E domain-containing protein [Halieaceae bacterium]